VAFCPDPRRNCHGLSRIFLHIGLVRIFFVLDLCLCARIETKFLPACTLYELLIPVMIAFIHQCNWQRVNIHINRNIRMDSSHNLAFLFLVFFIFHCLLIYFAFKGIYAIRMLFLTLNGVDAESIDYACKIVVRCQIVNDDNATYELEVTARDHGDPPRSSASPLRVMFVVSRLIRPASEGTAAGRRRAGGVPLLGGWVSLAVAAACAVGVVVLCSLLAVLGCIVCHRHRRRRDCSKHHQNVDAAEPLTGKYNCRIESLKVVSICDNSKG